MTEKVAVEIPGAEPSDPRSDYQIKTDNLVARIRGSQTEKIQLENRIDDLNHDIDTYSQDLGRHLLPTFAPRGQQVMFRVDAACTVVVTLEQESDPAVEPVMLVRILYETGDEVVS